MKLQDAREHYYFQTGKVSEITRQLAFAAIAVIWLFKIGEGTAVSLPNEPLLSLKLVVVCLALDLLQYIFGSICWGAFQRLKERAGTSEASDFTAPSAINWAAITCFWSKTVVLVYAYWVLFAYLQCIISVAR